MTRHILALAAVLTALGLPALAQDTTTPPAEGGTVPAPVTTDLSLGREEGAEADDGIGATYVAAMHGDWEQRCIRTEDGADPCNLYQLLRDDQGNAVAEFSIFGLPAGQQAVAGATAIVPLETLLTSDLSLQVDAAKAKLYPFSWCSPIGCVARIGFTQAEVDAMKRGNAATMTIVPAVAPDQKVALKISLRGFTAGLTAVNTANAAVSAAPAAGGN